MLKPAIWDPDNAIRGIANFGEMTDVEKHDALTAHHRLFQETAEKLAKAELRLVKEAVTQWAESCGVSVEEWGRYYGYRTERAFQTTELGDQQTLRISVFPVALGGEPPWLTKPVMPGASEQAKEP